MTRPVRGLYEALITDALDANLRDAGPRAARQHLRVAEAADRIALHLAGIVERAVFALPDAERVESGIALARDLVALISERISEAGVAGDGPVEPGSVLEAISDILPDGSVARLPTPLIPLLDTALLTNAPGEPRVGSQLLAEIPSADRVDVLMAFIRLSGIAPMLPALTAHCGAGRGLRVLTTTFTGTTQASALNTLLDAGAEVRVSYDTSSTRLHAKAWHFHRESGFGTAYIGSSNLTRTAQHSGLEWNLRVSGARNPAVVGKIAAVFESYWSCGDFVPFERSEFETRTRTETSGPHVVFSPIEVRPEPFQERLLEQIAASRVAGHHRNLLASATGTGKTVMAAVDYARLRPRLPRSRLLFVAHREELLAQGLATFRHALRDHAFGELWVGGRRPSAFEHVFASIQSLGAAGLENLDPAHFDVVIVDEFHHAAAPSYRALLEHVRPVELLGLTATPERSDGLPVLDWFDGRIAAELRLWDAIDQRRLSPFAYYGVHDGMDLRQLPWRRGRGYDVEGLSNLLTANDAWARLVLAQVTRRIDSPVEMKALGFCVSVEHAQFMARVFSEAGVAARAVWADTTAGLRTAALAELRDGRIQEVSLDTHPDVPLQVHARYSRLEILGAFGIGTGAKVPPWQTGVYWASAAGADLFAFTLDKTSGSFSPTTRYRDYAINRELIHWESQSGTRADSETGRRYQEQARRGSSVMLFARLRDDDRAFWFLGPARYVSHRGERPMAITWRLDHALSGDLFSAFAAAVA